MGRVAKKPAEVVPVAAEEFADYVACFKREFPEAWEELRLQPLQHGLDNMAKLLK